MNLTTTAPEIPRDRWGRPLVVPPSGGKPVGYQRCTTFVGALEDTYNLGKWQQRMVAKGVAMRPDIHLAIAATPVEDKAKLDKLCEDAREAAAASAAATTGTAIHGLTELVDRGQPLPPLPDSAVADLDAYRRATACLEVLRIEQFGVVDDLKVGGTWDRMVRHTPSHPTKVRVGDIKTGSIEYGIGKIAMQLAVYSRAIPYDHVTGARTPHPFDVDQDLGIVIHVPAGTGTAELVWVDLAAGWQAVQLARDVHAWRKRKDLSRPFDQVAPAELRPAALTDTVVTQAPAPATEQDLDDVIATAPDVDTLTAIWVANQHRWNQAHTDLAAARKALLQGGLVA